MDNSFFSHPILNSPYAYPACHWELDKDGQPTQQIIERHRSAEFITPIPKPRKRKQSSKPSGTQLEMVTDEGKGLSTSEQQYDPTGNINLVRNYVDQWRMIPDPNDWKVTPETAWLLQHWRNHPFADIRPFSCQGMCTITSSAIIQTTPPLFTFGLHSPYLLGQVRINCAPCSSAWLRTRLVSGCLIGNKMCP